MASTTKTLVAIGLLLAVTWCIAHCAPLYGTELTADSFDGGPQHGALTTSLEENSSSSRQRGSRWTWGGWLPQRPANTTGSLSATFSQMASRLGALWKAKASSAGVENGRKRPMEHINEVLAFDDFSGAYPGEVQDFQPGGMQWRPFGWPLPRPDLNDGGRVAMGPMPVYRGSSVGIKPLYRGFAAKAKDEDAADATDAPTRFTLPLFFEEASGMETTTEAAAAQHGDSISIADNLVINER